MYKLWDGIEELKPGKYYYALKIVTGSYYSPLYFASHLRFTPGSKLRQRRVDKNRNRDCGPGIHLATVEWIRDSWWQYPGVKKIVVIKFMGKSAVIPYDFNGKFRVGSCEVVDELTEMQLRKLLQGKKFSFENT